MRWWSRIWLRALWRLRGPRKVLLHLDRDRPSIQGILLGVWGGAYTLTAAGVWETRDRMTELTGMVQVPAQNVVFVQVVDA